MTELFFYGWAVGIDDPEGYDGGTRIQAIETLHRFITKGNNA